MKGDEAALIAGAVAGWTYADIAAAVGVSVKTVQRRLQDPEIQAAVARVTQASRTASATRSRASPPRCRFSSATAGLTTAGGHLRCLDGADVVLDQRRDPAVPRAGLLPGQAVLLQAGRVPGVLLIMREPLVASVNSIPTPPDRLVLLAADISNLGGGTGLMASLDDPVVAHDFWSMLAN